MLRIVLAALALAGCAGQPIAKERALQRSREDVRREHSQQALTNLQDDFNRAYGEN